MQQGVVKFFREDRGYGFIERDQGGDLFVHISGVDGTVDTLVRGQRVAFEEGANRRTGKLEAKNVTVIEASKPENISGYRLYRMDAQPGDWLTY
jgi:cold shock protein